VAIARLPTRLQLVLICDTPTERLFAHAFDAHVFDAHVFDAHVFDAHVFDANALLVRSADRGGRGDFGRSCGGCGQS
jgi:hypothetical protein